jgi:hypothetical protein
MIEGVFLEEEKVEHTVVVYKHQVVRSLIRRLSKASPSAY